MSDNKDKHNEESRPDDKGATPFDDIINEIVNEDEAAEGTGSVDETATEDPMQQLQAQLDEEKAKVEKEKKEYLFLMAEFDNFRKRTVREKADIIRNASEKVLLGLLPIVDDFERGLAATADSDDADNIRQGMELIYNKLIKYLEQNGVKPIESTGADFDPELHDALTSIPAADDSQRGKVIDTPTKGYMLNDKVLRHAKVVVAQ